MSFHNTTPIDQINGYVSDLQQGPQMRNASALQMTARDTYFDFLAYVIRAQIENPISFRQFGNLMAGLGVKVNRWGHTAYIFTKHTGRL